MLEYVCTYCGLLADTVDHIPPVSIRPVLVQLGLAEQYPFIVVRCCRECNSSLGDKAFWTVDQRRAYIALRLARRYRYYLSLPEWTADELNTLDDRLRQETIHKLNVKMLVLKRIENASSDTSTQPLTSYIPEARQEVNTPSELVGTNPLCVVCDKPIVEGMTCSELCEYIATGRVNAFIRHLQKHKDIARILRYTLKKIPKERRRQLKVTRFELALQALRS